MTEAIVFEQLGEEGIASLVTSFYGHVRGDDLIGPMYHEDWEGAEKRLRDFLVFRFGGSQRYIEERGHPRLRIRHAPFRIGDAERDRWIQFMTAAMNETAVPSPSREILINFFNQTADFMRNQPE